MNKFVHNSLFRRLQIEGPQFLKYLFKEYDWISVGAVSAIGALGANSHKKT